MKKVLIIAYYFPPLGWSGVQRTLKFVKYLREFGWEPVVLTVGATKFSILDNTLVSEIPENIEIIKIDDIKFKDVTDNILRELQKYIDSSLNIISDEKLKEDYQNELEKRLSDIRNLLLLPDGNAIWANNVIKELDNRIDFNEINLVYSTSGPYSAHIVGEYIKKKYHVPWVADFRDQWMNNPYIDYDKDSLRYKLESNIEKNIVINCDKMITTTPISRKNYINEYKVDKEKIITITNGYDEDDFKKLPNNKISKKKFKIIHNGSFYLKRNPYTFFIAINNLINNKLIDKKFIEIIFNGKNDEKIIREIETILGENKDILIINGYLSHEESLFEAYRADILLLICGSGEAAKEVYTGKVFEYLRLKRPIMAISPSGSLVEELLEETKCGLSIEYDDIDKIEKSILYYYKAWLNNVVMKVEALNIEKYERRNLTKQLSQVFNEIVR